jgi:hypothetical protein
MKGFDGFEDRCVGLWDFRRHGSIDRATAQPRHSRSD